MLKITPASSVVWGPIVVLAHAQPAVPKRAVLERLLPFLCSDWQLFLVQPTI